jgi:hypothetical protein
MEQGYAIYDPEEEWYFDKGGSDVTKDMAFLFDSLDAATMELTTGGWDFPESYEIHKVKREFTVLEKYHSKLYFEKCE